jgi:hypothetical protein
MSHCYALRHTDGRLKSFVELDEDMCRHFGVQPHPVRWLANWENEVGLGIALGLTPDRIAEYLPPDALPVLDYIRQFEWEVWREFGRR